MLMAVGVWRKTLSLRDVMLDVSRRRLHERAIVNFKALGERTNPSGGSHRRLFERYIINFQALTDRANHRVIG